MLKNYKFGCKFIDDICSFIEYWIWVLSYCIVSYLDNKAKSPMELEREKQHQYFEMSKGYVDLHFKRCGK